jgi:hypothetical protein
MTLQEYKKKLEEIKKAYEFSKINLIKEYAFTNNPYKEGDVFTDHIGSIRVEQIQVTVHNETPSCIYTGLVLKADGKPTKKMEKRSAYQINEKNGALPDL